MYTILQGMNIITGGGSPVTFINYFPTRTSRGIFTAEMKKVTNESVSYHNIIKVSMVNISWLFLFKNYI